MTGDFFDFVDLEEWQRDLSSEKIANRQRKRAKLMLLGQEVKSLGLKDNEMLLNGNTRILFDSPEKAKDFYDSFVNGISEKAKYIWENLRNFREQEEQAYMEGVDECVRAFRQQKQGKGWFDAPHKNGFFTTNSKEDRE